MTAQAILFTPAAQDAQWNFREALECMARPGRIGQLRESSFPEASARFAYSLLVTLADQEVSIAVTGEEESLARFASLGTGSRIAPVNTAQYLLCLGDPGETLIEVRRGSDEVPEDGATAILRVNKVEGGDCNLRLRGPGILGETRLSIDGLAPETIAARNIACANYPLGIDLFLVDSDGRLAGIPRTTAIALED